MLPGFVFSIIATVLKIVFSSEMSRPIVISFEEIVHGYLYPYDNPMRELWFIVTLLWLFLLAPIWELTLKNRLSMWGTFIVLVIIHFFHPPIGFLCVDRVFSHAVWFLLGIIISKENIVTALLENNASLITICVGVIVYAIGNYTSPFITTIGCIIFSFGLALWADKYVPKLFCGFRNYTYQIFLMGIFFQIFVKILYRYISMPYIVAYILCILMGLYAPVLVSKIVKIIKWKPLSLCVGLK